MCAGEATHAASGDVSQGALDVLHDSIFFFYVVREYLHHLTRSFHWLGGGHAMCWISLDALSFDNPHAVFGHREPGRKLGPGDDGPLCDL